MTRPKPTIEERLSGIATGANTGPADMLLEMQLEAMHLRDPQLARAVELCAIPRRVDGQMAAMLLDLPNEGEGAAVLRRIQEHALLEPATDREWEFHQLIRGALLERWTSNPERGTVFRRQQARLVSAYEQRFEDAMQEQRDLGRLRGIINSASLSRYAQLNHAVGRALVDSLDAALHHAAQLSVADINQVIERMLPTLEQDPRLAAIARRRIEQAVAADSTVGAQGSEAEVRGQLILNLACLLTTSAEGGPAKAASLLRGISQDAYLSADLRQKALERLGEMLALLDDFEGVRATLEERRRAAMGDVRQLCRIEAAEGRLDRMLLDASQAAEHYRAAESLAREAGSAHELVTVKLGLAASLRDLADWSAGLHTALDALLMIKLGGPLRDGWSRVERDSDHEQALKSVLLLAAEPAWGRLLHTVHAEARGVSGAPPETAQGAWQRFLFGLALRRSRQLASAERIVSSLADHPATGTDPELAVSLAFEAGAIAFDREDLAGALAAYNAAQQVALTSGPPWDVAAAALNKGRVRLLLGDLDGAERELEESMEVLHGFGHMKLEALVSCHQAEIAARQGDMELADELVDNSRSVLLSGSNKYQAELARAEGVLHMAREQWSEAVQAFARAARLHEEHRDWTELALDMDSMNVAISSGGQPPESIVGSRSGELSRVPADYTRSAEEKEADVQNSLGVAVLVNEGPDPRLSAERAREHFINALLLDGSNAWIRLNLAFALMRLERWEESSKVLLQVASENQVLPVAWLRLRAKLRAFPTVESI